MYLFRFPRMPHIIRFSHSVCLLFYAFTDQWRNVLYYKRVYDEGIVLVFLFLYIGIVSSIWEKNTFVKKLG